MISDQDGANEERRTLDAVVVALTQLGLGHHRVIVRPDEALIQIQIWLPRWSLRRFVWWWDGYERGVGRIERRVLSMLLSLEGPHRRWFVAVVLEEP